MPDNISRIETGKRLARKIQEKLFRAGLEGEVWVAGGANPDEFEMYGALHQTFKEYGTDHRVLYGRDADGRGNEPGFHNTEGFTNLATWTTATIDGLVKVGIPNNQIVT